MNLGAEPKRLAILGGLVLVAGYMIYSNVFSQPVPQSAPATPQTQVPARTAAAAEAGGPVPRAEAPAAAQSALQEFRPSLKPKRGAELGDLSSIDPTLRLDLLAKLRGGQSAGGRPQPV